MVSSRCFLPWWEEEPALWRLFDEVISQVHTHRDLSCECVVVRFEHKYIGWGTDIKLIHRCVLDLLQSFLEMTKSEARREGRPLCWSLVELGLQPCLSSEDSKEQLRFLERPDQVSGVID